MGQVEERFLQLRCDFICQSASAVSIWSDQKRAVGSDDVASRACRISFCFTLGQPKASEQRLLRSVFRKPAVWCGTAGFNSKLPPCNETAHVGSRLSTTDDFSQDPPPRFPKISSTRRRTDSWNPESCRILRDAGDGRWLAPQDTVLLRSHT